MVELKVGWSKFMRDYRSLVAERGMNKGQESYPYLRLSQEELYKLAKSIEGFKVVSSYYGFTARSIGALAIYRKYGVHPSDLRNFVLRYLDRFVSVVVSSSHVRRGSISYYLDRLGETRITNSIKKKWGTGYCNTVSFESFFRNPSEMYILAKRTNGFGETSWEKLKAFINREFGYDIGSRENQSAR